MTTSMEQGKASLSPSRASDFIQCPLLFRFRVVDKLPEKPSAAAVKGTVVHSVLEQLFEFPAEERTVAAALDLLEPSWENVQSEDERLVELFADDEDGSAEAAWLQEAAALVQRWFTMEDPRRLEPAERELYVETQLEDGLTLRGYVDRLDVAPDGRMRIVDYKTGKSPGPAFESKALFQMKFYALVLWRQRGTLPTLLQLTYLGDGQFLRYEPQEADLLAMERKLQALWKAIETAAATGDWRPSPSKLCNWCDHKAICPSQGGTPPPVPEDAPLRIRGIRPSTAI